MKIKPIKTLWDYEQSKKHLNSFLNKKLTPEESNDLEVLEILIEDFEKKGVMKKENVVLEPILDYIYDLVIDVSNLEKPGILERGLKLGEEYGELSAEILKMVNYKKTTEDKKTIENNILLESTDCLIMIFDIMNQMKFTKEEICNMAEKQINKWIKNFEYE